MLVRTGSILSHIIKSQEIAAGKRNFWQYLIGAFNQYDKDRVKEVGPDRAAAEWLLKNGAFVRWQGHHEVLSDYNLIGVSGGRYIEGIDCTGSSVSNAGFRYLNGLKHVRELKLVNCWSVSDGAMRYVSECIPDKLEHLEVISNNISEEGLLAIRNCKALKHYRVGNLPAVDDMPKTIEKLKKEFPSCQIEHVTQVDESHNKKPSFWSGLFR